MVFGAQVAIGAGLTTIYHPIAYAKVLIQTGHEPLLPYPTTTIFGNEVYMYPNVFKYIGHIYRCDGFFGLYRGLSCKLISSAINTIVTYSVQSRLYGKPLYCKEYDEIDDEIDVGDAIDISKLMKETACETLSRCAGIIVSQPFYVISIRAMAQFVGRETRFSSLFSAIPDIWRNEGILGYFSGIIPRIIGETLTIFIANFLAYAVNSIIMSVNQQSTNPFKTHTGMVSQVVASQITYPFTLVSVVMAVSGSGLAAGSLPLMPAYDGWTACWNNLTKTKELKRGSSLFWRRCYRPKHYMSGGVVMPTIEYVK